MGNPSVQAREWVNRSRGHAVTLLVYDSMLYAIAKAAQPHTWIGLKKMTKVVFGAQDISPSITGLGFYETRQSAMCPTSWVKTQLIDVFKLVGQVIGFRYCCYLDSSWLLCIGWTRDATQLQTGIRQGDRQTQRLRFCEFAGTSRFDFAWHARTTPYFVTWRSGFLQEDSITFKNETDSTST